MSSTKQTLSPEALKNLTGYFEVLIRIDQDNRAKAKEQTERANGYEGKTQDLVPISIITGTKTKRATK